MRAEVAGQSLMYGIIYIVACLTLACIFHFKVPFVRPKTDGPSSLDGCLAAMVLLNLYVGCAIMGFVGPMILQQGRHLDFGPDWLLRLSQVVGGVTAFYVAKRGTFVWGVLIIGAISIGILYLLGLGILATWRFVVHGTF